MARTVIHVGDTLAAMIEPNAEYIETARQRVYSQVSRGVMEDKAGKPCPICAMDFEELGEYIDGCGICFDRRLIDKETQIIECPNCYGRGEVWALDMISCAHCNGRGVVRR